MELLAYERLDEERLVEAIFLRPGEHLLMLLPFGWHLDGRHIPNAAEHFARGYVCACLEMEVVDEFGPYIAIVRDCAEKRNRAGADQLLGQDERRISQAIEEGRAW